MTVSLTSLAEELFVKGPIVPDIEVAFTSSLQAALTASFPKHRFLLLSQDVSKTWVTSFSLLTGLARVSASCPLSITGTLTLWS